MEELLAQSDPFATSQPKKQYLAKEESLVWGRGFTFSQKESESCIEVGLGIPGPGSIQPRATKKHQNHLRVVFSFVGIIKKTYF